MKLHLGGKELQILLGMECVWLGVLASKCIRVEAAQANVAKSEQDKKPP